MNDELFIVSKLEEKLGLLPFLLFLDKFVVIVSLFIFTDMFVDM